jgi:arylsulfatase A-like enzyme
MEIAGLNPASMDHLEGLSLLPLLKGEETIWRNEVFLIYDMKYHAVAHMRMIRTKRWKLIHHYEDEAKNELYDLKNDPGELENLYGTVDCRSAQHILTRRLKQWEERVGATKADLLLRREPY